MIFLYVLLGLVLLFLAFLFLIAPSRTGKRAESWRGTTFAHRGLHRSDAPENSLAAFDRACRAGVGIELDVQLSADGEVVVFHDDDLLRMTGDPRRVDEVPLAGLRRLRLKGGAEIPTFRETLELVNGRAPLLVELKHGKRNAELCEKTAALLKQYDGPYVVESFNPFILRWFAKNAPEIIRGQLVSAWKSYRPHQNLYRALVLSAMLLNFLARPDFVAYDVNNKAFRMPRLLRRLFHPTMAAWTVRDRETYKACLERGEMPIFEGFIPD